MKLVKKLEWDLWFEWDKLSMSVVCNIINIWGFCLLSFVYGFGIFIGVFFYGFCKYWCLMLLCVFFF